MIISDRLPRRKILTEITHIRRLITEVHLSTVRTAPVSRWAARIVLRLIPVTIHRNIHPSVLIIDRPVSRLL